MTFKALFYLKNQLIILRRLSAASVTGFLGIKFIPEYIFVKDFYNLDIKSSGLMTPVSIKVLQVRSTTFNNIKQGT